MALAQSLTAIIIFWAIIGGLGASLLLPAMQSLIHGNFEGAAQKQGVRAGRRRGRDRRRGRPAARRLHHHLPVVAGRVPARGRGHRRRAVRASGSSATCRTPGRGRSTSSARCSRSSAWAASCSASSSGRRAARPSARSSRSARSRWRRSPTGCVRRKRAGQADAARPRPVQVEALPVRHLRADAPADRARRHDDRAADLPADGARVQRDAGRPVARAAVAEHVRGGARSPGSRPGTAAPEQRSSGPASRCSPSGSWC